MFCIVIRDGKVFFCSASISDPLEAISQLRWGDSFIESMVQLPTGSLWPGPTPELDGPSWKKSASNKRTVNERANPSPRPKPWTVRYTNNYPTEMDEAVARLSSKPSSASSISSYAASHASPPANLIATYLRVIQAGLERTTMEDAWPLGRVEASSFAVVVRPGAHRVRGVHGASKVKRTLMVPGELDARLLGIAWMQHLKLLEQQQLEQFEQFEQLSDGPGGFRGNLAKVYRRVVARGLGWW